MSIIVNVVASGRGDNGAILENDIEKEEQKEQSDSERVRNAMNRLAPGNGVGD